MPDRIVLFPVLNGIQFSEEDKEQHPAHDTKLTDKGFDFNENIPSHLDKRFYAQPLRFDDFFTIQVHSNANIHTSAGNTPRLQLLDKSKNVLYDSGPFVYESAIPGHVWTDPYNSNNVHQLITYAWELSLSVFYGGILTLGPGIYYLRYVAKWDDDGGGSTDFTKNYISSPLWVKENWPGTLWLQYACSTNRFGALFENGYNPRFGHRVGGTLGKYDPGSTDTAYVDQGEDIVMLESQPFDTYQVVFAGESGVPDYEQKKLNYIFACDEKFIDGEQFEKEEGAKFEIQRVEGYPLAGISLKVRPSRNTPLVESAVNIVSIPYPESHPTPWAIANLRLIGGLSNVPLSDAVVVEDTTAGEALATTLDGTTGAKGLLGTFSFASDRLSYTQGNGENILAFGGSVCPYFFRVYVECTADGQQFTLQYRTTTASATADFVIEWGDGSTERIPAATTVTTLTHTYATAASYTIRAFHYNMIDTLYFGAVAGTPDQVDLLNIDAQMPAQLAHYKVLGGATLDTSFTLEHLKYSWQYLRTISLANSTFTAADPGQFFEDGYDLAVAAYQAAGYSPPASNVLAQMNAWNLIVFIDLRNNALNTTKINSFIEDLFIYANWPGNFGVMSLQGQTPSAPPSGTAASNISTMINNGWVIATD